jgi:hypothetical protein
VDHAVPELSCASARANTCEHPCERRAEQQRLEGRLVFRWLDATP